MGYDFSKKMKPDENWWKLMKTDENKGFHQISSDFISFHQFSSGGIFLNPQFIWVKKFNAVGFEVCFTLHPCLLSRPNSQENTKPVTSTLGSCSKILPIYQQYSLFETKTFLDNAFWFAVIKNVKHIFNPNPTHSFIKYFLFVLYLVGLCWTFCQGHLVCPALPQPAAPTTPSYLTKAGLI